LSGLAGGASIVDARRNRTAARPQRAPGFFWPAASRVANRCIATSTMTEFETELANLIADELNLQDLDRSAINAETPLYGDGFGLDSIDILEISLIISKKYGLELRSDNPDNKIIFASLGNLAAYVLLQRSK
jgi:acyl carrier protein